MLPWLMITGQAKSVYQVYARLCYCSSPSGELLKFLLTPFMAVISVVRISCQTHGFVIEFPVIGFPTQTILCRDTGKAREFLCFTLRLASQRYKTWVLLSIKTKTRVACWSSYNLPLGLCTFPTTHGGVIRAIGQKAVLTPSPSRKDQAGTSFCQESRKLYKSDSLALPCTWLYCQSMWK